jgi:ubiquinone/menaquinone biosynthesis C-methylase UbiE
MYVKEGTEKAYLEEFSSQSILLYPETADIETASEAYAMRFKGKVGEWFLKVQEDAIMKMVEPYKQAKILDIGGGHGQTAGIFINQNHNVTVFGSTERCHSRLQEYIDNGTCNFHTGHILELPYADCSFDIVVSFRLLPHLKRWKNLITEAARVAKREVIIDYPELCSVNYFAPAMFNLKKSIEKSSLTRPYVCFKEDEITRVFKDHGFVRIDRFAEFFMPMVFHRMLNFPKMSILIENFYRKTGLTEKFGSPVILKFKRDNFRC